MEAKDLVIVTLGSVQPFIAASRRTQDLLTASQLLSLLARCGVETARELGVEMIFPVNFHGDETQSIPNRFVFATSSGQGKDVATKVEHNIREAWKSLANQVQTFFSRIAPEPGWEQIWKRQVATGPEVYWVVYPWQASDDYGTTYQKASLALDARKRVRWYPIDAEPGEKCTLDGIHQALSGHDAGKRDAIRAFWKKIAEHPKVTPADVRDGERLCAISTIKRFAAKAKVSICSEPLESERFPSTSSIAVANFRQGLLDCWNDLQTPIEKYLNVLDTLGNGARFPVRRKLSEAVPFFDGEPNANRLLCYDGDIFYKETFAPARLKEMLGEHPNEDVRQDSLENLKILRKQAQKQDIPLPSTYLSVLMLDGDNMGKLLGACDMPKEHETISNVLTHIAKDMKHIVEQYINCMTS